MTAIAETDAPEAAASTWWVYMVRTQSGRLYTGITTDIERRLHEHRYTRRGARFFRTDPADCVVYKEKAPNRSAASRREASIKQLSRRQKLSLITGAD